MYLSNEAVKELIESSLQCEEVIVTGDGYHYQAVIVSDIFSGLSAVKKQQKVYASLGNSIASGALHALSMQTYTPEEWKKQKVFYS